MGEKKSRDALAGDERQAAAAIEYDAERDKAPRVTARGFGFLAERIIEAAKRHGVPVRVDKDLARVLAKLDLGSEIPPELFRAVAEILAVLYRANREAAPSASSRPPSSRTPRKDTGRRAEEERPSPAAE
ncbi:MAG: EscU/YscU/HrcU family type III secretion system export apparatus switch protein [Deltaproteobacteria bacterium]|nr:EscU/YscU/HrcU family type III secretion system export apparatus switch protein [Deltaproteobacteria bacterium]